MSSGIAWSRIFKLTTPGIILHVGDGWRALGRWSNSHYLFIMRWRNLFLKNPREQKNKTTQAHVETERLLRRQRRCQLSDDIERSGLASTKRNDQKAMGWAGAHLEALLHDSFSHDRSKSIQHVHTQQNNIFFHSLFFSFNTIIMDKC